MLFAGEAIFGVVDLLGSGEGARCKAEAVQRKAADLGMYTASKTFGAATFCCATRKHCRVKSPDPAVVIAGEVFSTENRADGFSNANDWLAQGYQTRGMQFLSGLDGTFALALWDEKQQKLILMTDRRSDAHLFYRLEDNELFFSSWLPLLVTPAHRVSRFAVQEFLRFLYIAAPRTIYEGINRLEPGYCLAVSGGHVGIQPIRKETLEGSTSPVEPDRVLSNFQNLFESAIHRRIGSRRAAVFLSSGVDSSTLMAGCHRVNPGQVEAFTVGFDNAELDEANAAAAYARHFGVPHTVLSFGIDQYRQAFDRMAGGFDQPFGDPAGLPLVLASEAASGCADVITGGTGGDDLFGAPIPRHLKFSLEVAAKIAPPLRRYLSSTMGKVPWSRLSSYASLFDFDEAEELLITWPGWSKRELEALLGERVSFEGSGFYRMFATYRKTNSQKLYDALAIFPPDDCRFEAAALADIPTELPYHDLDLHKFVQSLPRCFRAENGVAKILLKRLFARYFPANLRLAKKHYFNIPLQSLLADKRFAIVREYLAPDVIARHGLMDYKRAWERIDRFIAGDETLRFKVWALLVLHAWLDKHRCPGER